MTAREVSSERLPECCPHCDLNWIYHPPAIVAGTDKVRCIECKTVLVPPVSSERVSEERLRKIIEWAKRYGWDARESCNVHEMRDMASEILSLRSSVKTVGVKALEWEATGDRDWVADCVLGQYQVNRDLPSAGGAFNLWKAGWNDVDDFADFETLKEAKAAAQADYERRVLSAIEAPAASSEVTEAALKAINKLPRHVMETSDNNGDVFVSLRRVRAALKGDRP